MVRPDASAGSRGRPSVERFFQFSLLGLVASGYLAVAGSGYLDAPTVALVTLGLLLRGLAICGWLRVELSERTATWATLGYIAFFPADYFFLSHEFLPATVHLVFFLAVMKVLTSRSNRDYLYTAVIAFLELVAGAILSINFNFFLCLALYLLFAMAALTSGEIRRSIDRAPATARGGLRRFHGRLAALTAAVTLGILALTAGLFFLLPRTADAALARLISHRIFIPGFSNQVTLGEIGEIKTSSRPVMHIQIFSRESPGALKWRGGALTEFDGKRWFNANPRKLLVSLENGYLGADLSTYGRSGRYINYHVDVDALESDALFFAGIPERVDLRYPDLYRTETGCFRLQQVPPQGFQYSASSLLPDPPESARIPYPPPVLRLAERAQYLQLPPLDERIPALASVLTGGAVTDLERARALERHLRADYGYTLQLPARELADPLSYFLFVRKKGHCEYFASALAVMLRTLGIPARLATGFQSGVYNPISDLWLVRASDAHSWVEAWIPGHGWTTFDPTPPDPNPPGLSLFSSLGLYLDAAETFWQRWVVGYDPGRQGTLAYQIERASRLGLRWFDAIAGTRPDWDTRAAAWLQRFGLRLLWVLLAACWIWGGLPRLVRLLRVQQRVRRVRRGQASVADATLLYERMLHVLKRRGYQKPAWFTPAEFASSLDRAPLRMAVGEFTATYNALRFGGRTEVAPRLSLLLDELERQRQ
ncbi:MAG: DUF3488 and transglutaminase-like domain-containing protein [Acidobacteriia bacterium]|nr:DUF3488 and transglutaminase-like domain-containing protein [Terriglobia bacterium]